MTLVSCQVVDVDRMFTNMETVCEVSAALLHRLHEAIAELDKEAVVIGNGVRPPHDRSAFYSAVKLTSHFRPKGKYSSRRKQQ